MTQKPFLKWAGGKRWLADRADFALPAFPGRYIEPFLGGGAVFFSLQPKHALLSDINARLIETYQAIKADWPAVAELLKRHHAAHTTEYYYSQRDIKYSNPLQRAAQFIYFNRACWNGLYRENLDGYFNVPIGTKNNIVMDNDNFEEISRVLAGAELVCCDFENSIASAMEGDLVFADPPYTTAHNFNGFVKYNQNIFSWEDQVRLRDSLLLASERGALVVVTNADHSSVRDLYEGIATYTSVSRKTVISGSNKGRLRTTEALFLF